MQDSETIVRLLESITASALIVLALIVGGAIVLSMASRKLLVWLADKLHGQRRLYLLASIPLLRLLIIAVALVLILQQIAPTSQNILAVLGAAGLAIGFALKDYVSSIIAGIVAVNEMPYRPGDWIDINDTYGEVKHIGMRTIEIVTPDDTVVFIPHAKLWTELIANANDGSTNLQCVADFYLQPDHDATQVKDRLYDVVLASAYLQLDKPIVVILQEKPWGSHYRVKAYPIDPRQQFQFVSDLNVRGKATLRRLGVRFAAAGLQSRDGSETT